MVTLKEALVLTDDIEVSSPKDDNIIELSFNINGKEELKLCSVLEMKNKLDLKAIKVEKINMKHGGWSWHDYEGFSYKIKADESQLEKIKNLKDIKGDIL